MSLAFKILVLILTALASRMVVSCISLDEIHSSMNTFRKIHDHDDDDRQFNKKDKTLESALQNLRRLRQQFMRRGIRSNGLPIYAEEFYKRFTSPHVKKQDEQVMDVPLGYNLIGDYVPEESSLVNSDILTIALADKLRQLLHYGVENTDSLKTINMKKRSAFKRNKINKMKVKSKKNMTLNANDGLPPEEYFNYNSGVEQKIHPINSKLPMIMKGIFDKKNNKIEKRKSNRRVLEDHFNIEEVMIKGRERPTKIRKELLKASETAKSNNNTVNGNDNNSIASHSSEPNNSLGNGVTKSITKRSDHFIRRNKRITKTTDKKVLEELKNILGDDKSQSDRSVNENGKEEPIHNKTKQTSQTHRIKRISPDTKRSKRIPNLIDDENDMSDENENEFEQSLPIENRLIDEVKNEKGKGQWTDNKEDFDEWLRQEYYSTLARSLATMRKKRSDDDLFADGNDGEENNSMEEDIDENFISIDDTDDNADDRDDKNNDTTKLDKISDDDTSDDYVIATADDMDLFNDDDSVPNEEFEEKNKKKRKRSVSPYFGKILDDIDGESNEINQENEKNLIDEKLQIIEDSLIGDALNVIRENARKESISEAQRIKIENRLDAAYDLEDLRFAVNNLENTIEKLENEPNDDIQEDDTQEIRVIPIVIEEDDNERSTESDSNCVSLDLLTSDCSDVKDIVPDGKIGTLLTGACNWHEVCYTCGEIYGLLSTECDSGFLEASRLSCDGSASCEAVSRLILVPLRQNRIFYKRTVPLDCYQSRCVRDYLFEPQNRKR